MRKLQWAGVIAGTGLLVFLAAMGFIDWWSNDPLSGFRSKKSFGPAPPQPTVFRVGVLGDSQKGLANLRNIAREVMKQEAGFLLHTGDLVSTNDEGHYRLAFRYLRLGGADTPMVAPGNHDLKGGVGLFEGLFDGLEKWWVTRDVLFVLLNNANGVPPDPKDLEWRLARTPPHKAVVMAMHVPPFDVQGTPRPEYADFLAWLEKSNVAYLLCGHVHTYMKKKVGETTVIINGVGGDYDSWQLGQKVYATILDIDGSRITDRTIEIEPVHEFWENVEHLAIGHVGEAYRQHPLLCWAATLLLAGGVGWGWIRLFRKKAVA